MRNLCRELAIGAVVAGVVSLILVAAIQGGIGHKDSEMRALISKHRVQSPMATLP